MDHGPTSRSRRADFALAVSVISFLAVACGIAWLHFSSCDTGNINTIQGIGMICAGVAMIGGIATPIVGGNQRARRGTVFFAGSGFLLGCGLLLAAFFACIP
jgi:hypothetical protein